MTSDGTKTSERFELRAGQLLERFKQLIHEGNVRRVTVKQGDSIVAVFPLTAGLVGAVLAPVLAAVGALAAVLSECTIEVERAEDAPASTEDPPASTEAAPPADAPPL